MTTEEQPKKSKLDSIFAVVIGMYAGSIWLLLFTINQNIATMLKVICAIHGVKLE